MSRQAVLVSGAGIAGTTIAYWLLKRGFVPVLIEHAPRFREGGYIIDFWGVGFDVAERMGLIPVLRTAGYIIDRIEFVTQNSTRRSYLGANVFKRALGERFLSIQRGDLADAIYRTIENGVETIFGDSIVEIRQSGDAVEVTFERGRPRTFDLVIGADGLNSAVRIALFGPRENFERYLGYYAASFITSDYPWRTEHTYLSYAAPGRQISRYALHEGRTAFLLVFESQHKIARKRARSGYAETYVAANIFAGTMDRVARDRKASRCLRRPLFRRGQPDFIATLVFRPQRARW